MKTSALTKNDPPANPCKTRKIRKSPSDVLAAQPSDAIAYNTQQNVSSRRLPKKLPSRWDSASATAKDTA